MKFSAITALCAAPLALAGTLQAELVARGAVEVEARGMSGSKDQGKDSGMGSMGDMGGNNVIVQESSITEVIIIWVNEGGSSTTSMVNSAMSVSSTAAAATHTVSRFEPS